MSDDISRESRLEQASTLANNLLQEIRAAWVFAGARLISSANNKLVNTGPRRISNSCLAMLNMA